MTLTTDDQTLQRRADDIVTPTRKVVDRTLATSVLLFSCAFLYQMSEVLHKHACWCDFVEPAGVGEVAFALFCGLAAVASSLGLNVGSLVRGFKE